MRRASLFLLALAAAATPASANRCYGIDGRIYCDAGCRILETWWQGGTLWFRWTCMPPPELLLLAVAAVGAIIIVAIIGAITSRSSANTTALTTAAHEADARAAEAQRITERMRAAAAEADQFLKTYR